MFLQSLVKTPATAVSSGREHAKSPTLNSKSWDCRFNFMWSKTTQLFVRNTLRIDRFVNRFLHVATTFNHQFEKKLHISRLHHFTIVYLSSPILVSVLFQCCLAAFLWSWNSIGPPYPGSLRWFVWPRCWCHAPQVEPGNLVVKVCKLSLETTLVLSIRLYYPVI